MAEAAVKLKIMPDSPDTNLEEIEVAAKGIITRHEGNVIKVDREPVAFGLNAIIFTFSWNEEAEQDPLENDLREVEGVSSAEIIDFRRAFG